MSLRFLLPLLLLVFASCGSKNAEMFDKAVTAENQKKYAEAISLFQQFASENPSDDRTPEALFRLGNLIINHERQPLKGALVLEKIIESDSKSEFAHKGLFIAAFTYANSLGNTEKARKLYDRYLALYPDSSMASSARTEKEQLGLNADSLLNAMQQKQASTTPSASK